MRQQVFRRQVLRFVCIGGLLGAVVTRATVADEAQVSTKSGVYTDEQAARGEVTYANNCMGCHTTATYTEPTFRNGWNGGSVWELYSYISGAMPEDAPGSLSAKEYAQVIAYLLKLNRAPSGKTELPTDEAALKKIRIEIGAAPGRGGRRGPPAPNQGARGE